MKLSLHANNSVKVSRSFISGALAATLMIATSSTALAQPYALDLQTLDTISAGNALDLAASVEGAASAMGDLFSITGVQSEVGASSDVTGNYRIDTVFASGVSYACCDSNTNESTLDVNISSDADQQYGFIKLYAIDSPLISAKLGGGAIVGISRL